MKRRISWTFFMFLAIPPVLNEIQNAPIFTTKTGKVRCTRKFYKGHCIEVCYGIPYATPPVGDLRFKTTVPVSKWDGILDATKKPPACFQGPLDGEALDKESVQTEACLYLNIWTPCNKSSEKAVMVWIYGGNFTHGSASMSLYDGSELVSKGDVVLVNFNYRIGIFGFVTSKTADVPGNAGMYDQAEALKWIHGNIECFGGNSSSITLFGQSAGSISISMHAVSPLTSDLFHRAIMESGSSAFLLPAVELASNLEITDVTAKAVGCSTSVSNIVTQPDVVIECMRNKDPQLLVNISNGQKFFPQYGGSFMPNDPKIEIIRGKSKNCDRIMGITADEGSTFWARKFINIYGAYGEKDQHPTLNKNQARPMMTEKLVDVSISPGISDLVTEYYLNNVQGDDNEEVLWQAYTSAGDSALVCPSVFEAEKVAEQGNKVYYYVFNHRQTYAKAAEWMGVTHFSEVPFVFGAPLRQGEIQPKMKFTKEEMYLSTRMIKMWTNFAKTGSPVNNEMYWPTYSREQPFCRVLNTKELKIEKGSHQNNCDVFRAAYGF